MMKIVSGVIAALVALTVAAAAENVMIKGPDGSCSCAESGNVWACRKAIDWSAGVTCALNMNLKLICPEAKTETCWYASVPSCSSPPPVDVCWEGDKPK